MLESFNYANVLFLILFWPLVVCFMLKFNQSANIAAINFKKLYKFNRQTSFFGDLL